MLSSCVTHARCVRLPESCKPLVLCHARGAVSATASGGSAPRLAPAWACARRLLALAAGGMRVGQPAGCGSGACFSSRLSTVQLRLVMRHNPSETGPATARHAELGRTPPAACAPQQTAAWTRVVLAAASWYAVAAIPGRRGAQKRAGAPSKRARPARRTGLLRRPALLARVCGKTVRKHEALAADA